MKKKMMKNFSALITANSSCVFPKKCSKCFGICVCVFVTQDMWRRREPMKMKILLFFFPLFTPATASLLAASENDGAQFNHRFVGACLYVCLCMCALIKMLM